MTALPRLAAACAATLLCLHFAPPAAHAQSEPQPVGAALTHAKDSYEPLSGQPGKDVVWVPTPQALVDRMLEMAGVTPQDYLVDLGSGDGRTVITAAQRGTRALGIEYNPDMVILSKRAAEAEGVADRARFVQGDIFESDFSQATVVTLFLLPDLNLRLRPTLLDMKPGTRVVSNTFTMGDWTPDQSIDAGGNCTSYCRAYKWIIPAKVAGIWKLPEGELALDQTYQMLTGTIELAGKAVPIADARMDGDAIAFTADGRKFTGSVAGDRMTVASAGRSWTAARATK